MARAALTVIELNPGVEDDVVALTAAATDGHMYDNDGRTILFIKNADAAPKTITVSSVANGQGRTGDLSVVVTATAEGMVPFLAPKSWNQPDGRVYIDYSATTSTSVAAIRLKTLP